MRAADDSVALGAAYFRGGRSEQVGEHGFGVLDLLPHLVGGRATRVLVHELRERLVRPPDTPVPANAVRMSFSVSATTITRRPSLVGKSCPNAPYR